MGSITTADDAYAACEAIAEERSRATARTPYGDGYRAAAQHIANAIRAKREGRRPSPLERDLRDAEIEARTLARVVNEADRVVRRLGEHTAGADAVRAVLAAFYSSDELPSGLRTRDRASTVRVAG